MEDLSEKEQLDAMRSWWSENGKYVIGGILAGVFIIVGVNQYRSSKADAETAASVLYEEVMFAAGRENLDGAAAAAAELYLDYETSPYAAQARLAMARIYMDNGRDQDAANELRALVESNPVSELAMIGRLRLAKVLLYQNKADEVVALVNDQPDSQFSAPLNEVLGDAYVSVGQYAEAEAAYVAALGGNNPQAPTVDVNLVQLKINDLPFLGEAADSIESAESPAPPDATEGLASEEIPDDQSAPDDATTEAPPAEGEIENK
ncbi:MAG: tetratricopeptide repeat protein [Proteobacteria bacterium]|nr:tetratricopeptide repeat protein [Pseudomonadota bacterium]MDA0994913.1 tetratricopeptide repeat protein [Pseudomonadota bacterium]